jgi:hypothetical protein
MEGSLGTHYNRKEHQATNVYLFLSQRISPKTNTGFQSGYSNRPSAFICCIFRTVSPLPITHFVPNALSGLQPVPGRAATVWKFSNSFPITAASTVTFYNPSVRPSADAINPFTSNTLHSGHPVATGFHTPKQYEAQGRRIKSGDVCIRDPDNTVLLYLYSAVHKMFSANLLFSFFAAGIVIVITTSTFYLPRKAPYNL